jgi:hypothetical protein
MWWRSGGGSLLPDGTECLVVGDRLWCEGLADFDV